MKEKFILAPLEAVAGTIDPARMSIGEPGLPRQFRRGRETIQIARVLSTWRETGPCRHGSGERYARKHWFEVETDTGDRMKIYFERQARGARKQRWWLHTVEGGGEVRETSG